MNHSNKEWDDEQLLKAIQANDPRALIKIRDEMFPVLYIVAVKLVKDRTAAKDIARVAITNSMEARHKMESLPDLKSYMVTAAKNGSLNYLEHMKFRRRFNNEAWEGPEPSEEDADRALRKSEALKALIDGLKELTPQQRRIAWHTLINKMPTKELAKRMKKSMKTIQNQKSVIMAALWEKVKKLFP